MTRTRIKICGLTNADDAELCVALGATAVGFVFWPQSPRAVTPESAAAMARRLPPTVTAVGVFVNAAPDDVAAVVARVGLGAVQLHGEERADDYLTVGAALWKTVTLSTDAELDVARALPPNVTPLVDASDPVRRGGTGRHADWARAARLSAVRPLVLAGGLTSANIGDALAQVRPFAVDVSSGVERAPGFKSHERLRAFFDAVALADRARSMTA